MTTEEKFRAAVNVIKNLPKNGSYQPSHDLMLRFYAFFKQATEGPCKAPRPAFWEVVKKMKWEAWSRLGNMAREEAMDNYVEELKKIVETMSYTDNVASFLGSLDSFYDHVPAEDLELLVGPVIDRLRSQPGSPLSGSPFGSREASPSRGPGGRIMSSLETSPASSYSASPLPPEGVDDDEDEDEFKDTLEEYQTGPLLQAAPERFVKESGVLSGPTAKMTSAVLTNGYGGSTLNGYGSAHRSSASAPATPATERGRLVQRSTASAHAPTTLPAPTARVYCPPHGYENDVGVDISESISSVVVRLQQDLQQVVVRLGSLEQAMLARDMNNRKEKSSGISTANAVTRRVPRWWPLRDLGPNTVVLLTLWPIIVHVVLSWLQHRRRSSFSA